MRRAESPARQEETDLGNNLLGITLIALVIIIVAVLIILHFVLGIPGGTAGPTPTPIGLGHLPHFSWR